MSDQEIEIRHRIATLVASVENDHDRSRELFHYVWTMMCVRRGLLRVVREEDVGGTVRLVLEETRSGRHRIISRPPELDQDIESLAVQALARILGTIRVAS